MRVDDAAALTHAGRKRRRNEDAFIAEPPLFAVADGMGGAQAGEVASRLATAVFHEYREADDLGPEERLPALVQEANRRIYERARADSEASGMGTTLTAALVHDDRIVIGHVGDSRAYLVRERQIDQLTQDHSLVADLVRSGRLDPADADSHPQRSVITRALGTDPEVDVDLLTVEARPGDVFLLCSDGLTTMVADEEIMAILERADSLDDAAQALVRTANKQGGEDNVTVVLFTVAAAEDLEDTAVVSGNGRTDATEADLEDTLTGLEAPAAAPQSDHTVEITAPPEPAEAGREPARPRWRRRILLAALALLVVAALVAAAVWAVSRAYFVGAEDDGRVAVYQGLPIDVTDELSLYRARYVSRLQAVQLSPDERAELFGHDLVSYGDARDAVARYEAEGVPR